MEVTRVSAFLDYLCLAYYHMKDTVCELGVRGWSIILALIQRPLPVNVRHSTKSSLPRPFSIKAGLAYNKVNIQQTSAWCSL